MEPESKEKPKEYTIGSSYFKNFKPKGEPKSEVEVDEIVNRMREIGVDEDYITEYKQKQALLKKEQDGKKKSKRKSKRKSNKRKSHRKKSQKKKNKIKKN
jgi:hypothetical protein